MDPLSISASLTALLQLSSTVIRYLSDVRGGPKELKTVRLELCSILSLLSILQEQAEQANDADPWSSNYMSLNVPNGPIHQFRSALEQLHIKLAPVEGWKKLGKAFIWPFEREEILRILSVIERQKMLFALVRQSDHISLSRAIKADVETVHDKINEMGKRVERLDLSSRHHKIRLWLSAPDSSSNYHRALRNRHRGTGSWLLKNDVLRDWQQDTDPDSIFWLYGIPGCGKTVLCSTIIEYMLDKYARESQVAVLYFLFDFKDIDKQQHDGMVCSLLSQLSMHCAIVPPLLEELYSSCMDGGREPTLEALLNTLHQIATTFEKVFIIVDALDECDARFELMAGMEELFSWKDADMRILATSRRERDIEEFMLPLTKDRYRICMESALINDDIRAYVHDQLRTNKKLKRWQKDPIVQMEIEDTLLKKVHGMFRWATCQLDLLGNCLTLPKLRKALATLPRNLNDTYDRILCNINEEYQQYALHLLQWLAFSVRPLRLKEISEVVAIDFNDVPQFDPQRRLPDPGDVMDICSSLITVMKKTSKFADPDDLYNPDSRVVLAHFSVKEYLTSDIIQQGQVARYSLENIDCNISLTKDCLAYLLHLDGVESLTPDVLTQYPLARYVVKHWIKHARVAEKRDTTVCQDLFLRKGKAFDNWIRLRYSRLPSNLDMAKDSREMTSPLYFASATGLIESVRMILDKGNDINVGGAEYKDALTAASSRGNVEVVQLLLKTGAHLDSTGSSYGPALEEASSRGHVEIVRLLLEKGTNPDTIGASYGPALQEASSRGYLETVQLLLEKCAHLETTDLSYVTALRKASFRGHVGIVQFLLEKGVDVNARGDSRSTSALLEAIKGHNEDVAQLLIENGAVISKRNYAEDDPLESASYRGLQKIVELILDKEVDIEARGERYSGALAKASRAGERKAVQTLLDNGAVINAQVMLDALDGQSMEIMRMLLEYGGSLNGPDSQGRALCHYASARNNVTKLEMLVKLGSDLKVTDRQGLTCLHYAAKKEVRKRSQNHAPENHYHPSSTVVWLLRQGFEPNVQDHDGWTPLHWAAKSGNAETISILEDAGADSKIENNMGWTPGDVGLFHHHKISWKSKTVEA